MHIDIYIYMKLYFISFIFSIYSFFLLYIHIIYIYLSIYIRIYLLIHIWIFQQMSRYILEASRGHHS